MTTREVLEAAKAKIDKPQKWCRGYESRDGRRHCVLAAVELSGGLSTGRLRPDVESALWRALPPDDRALPPDDDRPSTIRRSIAIALYNDHHRHADVMSLLDRAIASCK